MLQDMDHVEASGVIYVKFNSLNRPERSNIWVLTVTTLGITMLTVHHDMMFSVCTM